MKFLVISFVLLPLGIWSQNPITWTALPDMPEKVSNNAVAEGILLGEPHVYSFAGIDTTKLFSGIHLKGFRYNTQTQIWDTIPPLPDTLGKIAAGASTVNNIIYIIGGYHVFSGGGEVSSDKVHRYDPATNSYLTDGAPIPKPIDDQVQCVWRDSLIFVITGWSNTGNVRDVQIYDPSADSWRVGASVPNSFGNYECFGASGTIIGDTIYYYGGAKGGINFPATDALRKGVIDPSDPTNITWSIVGVGPRRAYRSACFSHGERAFWLGGSTISYNYDGLAYFDGSGVNPANSIVSFRASTGNFTEWTYTDSVMDLRGVAQIAPNQWVVCGGMEEGQVVSKKSYLIEFDETYVGLGEPETSPLLIYPNPVSDYIWLGVVPDRVEVFDVNGQLVDTANTSKVDVSDLAKGLYLIKVFNGQGLTTASFVKN